MMLIIVVFVLVPQIPEIRIDIIDLSAAILVNSAFLPMRAPHNIHSLFIEIGYNGLASGA